MTADKPDIPLTQKLKSKDKTALKEIYQQYFAPCARIVLKDGGSNEDAREVFQEAVFSLLMKLENEDFVIQSNLKGYLSQSCFNIWVKHKRRGRKFISEADLSMKIETVDDGKRIMLEKEKEEEQYTQMYTCLNKLSENCNTLLKLSFFKKMKDEDIARQMEYKTGFVKQKRMRCMRSLRICMGA